LTPLKFSRGDNYLDTRRYLVQVGPKFTVQDISTLKGSFDAEDATTLCDFFGLTKQPPSVGFNVLKPNIKMAIRQ